MDITVKGEFVVDDYGALKDQHTGQSVGSLVSSAYKKGTVVRLNLVATYVDVVPLCHAQGRYGGECGEILDEHGNCPDTYRHKVEEEVTA